MSWAQAIQDSKEKAKIENGIETLIIETETPNKAIRIDYEIVNSYCVGVTQRYVYYNQL